MTIPDPFERLHPALQHHIVNTLGWSILRPTQLEAIEPILGGENCLLLAPTAGGKTEAAIFPILSKMLAESWDGLSVLYVCPIRALLNNLEPRLSRYLGMVGRQVGLWHGDVSASAKGRILGAPPDLLLTTPESVEGMLISRHDDRRNLLSNVRLVVVDELHAFGGDDRGWHVRALIRRLAGLNGRALQVVGLTATVGNPEALIRWLLVDRPGRVIGSRGRAAAQPGDEANLTLDHVGSLGNAAVVISRLHLGEKRLVFCDSRAKVEQLAATLHGLGVRTFVSHSSLSAQERRRAEAAFADESDCVIVATSTLELGIDVGDLDRVIQIDAPSTVSSFLQRMGRSGRRAGARRNYLFLATSDEGFLLAAALMRLWGEGFVEPVAAPPQPWHVVAQQAIARVLQGRGVARTPLVAHLAELFPELPIAGIEAVIGHMERQGVFADAGGLLWIGEQGEKEYGRRNFETVVSTFTSPMVFTVVYGREELGVVDPVSVLPNEGGLPTIVLGARYWRVVSVDWPNRQVRVEPSDTEGRASWLGASRALSYAACQAMKRVLIDGNLPGRLSKRAQLRLEELRNGFDFLAEDATTVVEGEDGSSQWWTFAGAGANFLLREMLRGMGQATRRMDDLSIRLEKWPGDLSEMRERLERLEGISVPIDDDDGLKFRACLPEEIRQAVMQSRMVDREGAEKALGGGVLKARDY